MAVVEKPIGLWLDGAEVPTRAGALKVISPFNGELVAEVGQAGPADLEAAIASARRTFDTVMRRMPAHEKARILRRTSDLIAERKEDFARTIALEAGKPIRDARAEVMRSVQVFLFAAEQIKSMTGEALPMDAALNGEQRWGLVIRQPIGVVAAISPFNFPLNLVSHKVAPALAGGNTVVVKPASKTPISALKLARTLTDAGLPNGALNVVVGSGGTIGDPLVRDPRINKVSFTGSMEVGEQLLKAAGLKRVTLELGSNSPNIICDDADLELAATAMVRAAFAYAGQVCISAQRLYVQRPVLDRFLECFIPKVRALKLGDPLDESTDLGPLIDESAIERTIAWVSEARQSGATVATGGTKRDHFVEPTVLVNPKHDLKVILQEVFAPVISVLPFDDDDEAIEKANDSIYGLQAGVFTTNIDRALRFGRELAVGGVWINESSIYRQDNYPYGGIKSSGLGREGVKYAIEEMTEMKFIGIQTRPAPVVEKQSKKSEG
ncbi:MAG: aldehyde dehydrogenase family protein [Candidatus Dormibacteraeota bacterium]|nr:aldehyde dehydrogenase family protein [Candidatus Dormibacteraeota bacterium]